MWLLMSGVFCLVGSRGPRGWLAPAGTVRADDSHAQEVPWIHELHGKTGSKPMPWEGEGDLEWVWELGRCCSSVPLPSVTRGGGV